MRLIIIGEYNSSAETHQATNAAIAHSLAHLGKTATVDWISSSHVSPELFSSVDGFLIAPGPPHQSPSNTISAITYGREHGTPVFGTCGGFQLMIVELARNVAGISDADHTEYSPDTESPVILQLSCSLRGMDLELSIKPNSKVACLYGALEVTERYYCSFGISPKYRDQIVSDQVLVVGDDAHGEVRIVELSNHPFFVASLFVPQARSTLEHPHPLVTGFLEACFRRAQMISP